MSVTGVVVAEREEKLRQVERVVGSDLLHGSESLCKLLRYLAEHCIDHPGAAVKEYQIATELFKRPQDFDPRRPRPRAQAATSRLLLLRRAASAARAWVSRSA